MDEEQAEPTLAISPAYDTATPDAYSNNSEIIIGESDVAIAFLHDLGFNNIQQAVVRIVMTHATFLNFVAHCNTRAKFIQDAYGGSVKTLFNNFAEDDEIWKQMIADMNAGKPVKARFEFSDDTNDK